MGKISLFLVGIFAFLGFSKLVFADCTDYYTEEEYNYIVTNTDPIDLDLTCSNETLFTNEYLTGVHNHLNSINSQAKKILSSKYLVYKLNVPNFRQQNNYYCGPANVKQVLHYLNGTSLTQNQYASQLGTTTSTYVYKIRDVLNNNSTQTYSYTLGNNYNVSSFTNLVKTRTSQGKPIILHARTNSLYMYNYNDLRHYLTVNGHTLSAVWDDYNGIFNIYYVDTYYEDFGRGSVLGEHMDSTDNVFGTVNISGRYIIH